MSTMPQTVPRPGASARDQALARAANDPRYAVALAKAALLEPTGSHNAGSHAVTASPGAAIGRHPAAVIAGSVVFGMLLWRSAWMRSALRFATIWGMKNVVLRRLSRLL